MKTKGENFAPHEDKELWDYAVEHVGYDNAVNGPISMALMEKAVAEVRQNLKKIVKHKTIVIIIVNAYFYLLLEIPYTYSCITTQSL